MTSTCLNPWNYLNIEYDGDCYFCCSIYSIDKKPIGNILEQSFDEIWNGEKAQEFRKSIIEAKYSHCNVNFCKEKYDRFNNLFSNNYSQDSLLAENPTVIQFSYDYTCSQRCIFCRDKIKVFSDDLKSIWNENIEKKIIPILKNCKLFILNGGGEIFDSEHSLSVINKIATNFPGIKFELFTNGIKCTQENLKKLGIEDRISLIHISVNAATKETYKKIFRSDNFEKVIDNLKYISELKKENKIKEIHLNFIVNAVNYKDMPKFVKLAEELDFQVSFSPTCPNETKFTQEDEIYNILSPKHYLYNDFIKRLQNPIFKSKHCCIDFDKNLKPISFFQTIKNYINTIRK